MKTMKAAKFKAKCLKAHFKIEYHGDIVAPIEDEWDLDEENLLPSYDSKR